MSAPSRHVSAKNSDIKTVKTAKIVARSKVEDIKSISRDVIKSKKQCNDILKIFNYGEVSLKWEKVCLL